MVVNNSFISDITIIIRLGLLMQNYSLHVAWPTNAFISCVKFTFLSTKRRQHFIATNKDHQVTALFFHRNLKYICWQHASLPWNLYHHTQDVPFFYLAQGYSSIGEGYITQLFVHKSREQPSTRESSTFSSIYVFLQFLQIVMYLDL